MLFAMMPKPFPPRLADAGKYEKGKCAKIFSAVFFHHTNDKN